MDVKNEIRDILKIIDEMERSQASREQISLPKEVEKHENQWEKLYSKWQR